MPGQSMTSEITSPTAEDLREQQKVSFDDPQSRLIASSRVDGTKVYRPDGKSIGRIHHFMVNKKAGVVEYAIMSFGGFLGLGEELRPLPWGALEYDEELGGYIVSAEDDTFRNSPFIEGGTAPEWDSAYAKTLYGFWGVPY